MRDYLEEFGAEKTVPDNAIITEDFSCQKESHTDQNFQHCDKGQISRKWAVREYAASIQQDKSHASSYTRWWNLWFPKAEP